MPLWVAILVGTVLWIPVVFGLACLVGRFIHDADEDIRQKWSIR